MRRTGLCQRSHCGCQASCMTLSPGRRRSERAPQEPGVRLRPEEPLQWSSVRQLSSLSIDFGPVFPGRRAKKEVHLVDECESPSPHSTSGSMTSARDRENRRLWEAGWWAPHPATRRWPRRGPQNPHRQERRAPLRDRGELGLRELRAPPDPARHAVSREPVSRSP